jgi:hypothetical protein
MVGVGQSAHAKNQFRAGINVSGDAQPVPDPRLETVELQSPQVESRAAGG